MPEQYFLVGVVKRSCRSFFIVAWTALIIALPACIITEDPPAHPNFQARAAEAAADIGFVDAVGGDTDETSPATCQFATDCPKKPADFHMTAVCVGEKCRYKCAGTFEDCDGNPAQNGCEADLSTSLSHCGSCGNACRQGASNRPPICVAKENTSGERVKDYICDVVLGECTDGYVDEDDGEGCQPCEVQENGDCIVVDDD